MARVFAGRVAVGMLAVAGPALAALAGAQSTPAGRGARPGEPPAPSSSVAPRAITQPVKHDTDDPAIWVNRANPADSLVLGTDKDADGALYVYGLDGRIREDKVVRGLLRPNNVDVAYDVVLGGRRTDVAVVTERFAHRLRVYRLPDMAPVDGGGIPVFEGERARDAMGIALYTRPSDGALFAVVSRSDRFAPREGYLHQYRLYDDGTGRLRGAFVRAFGEWSGRKEIEALAVDSVAGRIYASDETWGVRVLAADPTAEDADEQIASFGATGFGRDHEGIAILRRADGSGYVIVSDQQRDEFRFFALGTSPAGQPPYPLVARVKLRTRECDGIDLTTTELPGYPGGLFVAMSADRTFQFYAVDDLLQAASLPRSGSR